MKVACSLAFCSTHWIYSHSHKNWEPSAPALQSTRILNQLRERIRHEHYSFGTEKAYLHWVRFFVQ